MSVGVLWMLTDGGGHSQLWASFQMCTSEESWLRMIAEVGWYLCSLLLPMNAIWPAAWVPKRWTITWNYKSNGAFLFYGFFFFLVRCFIIATEIKLEYQITEVLTEFLWAQLLCVIMRPPATFFWLWGAEASAHCLFLFSETYCFAPSWDSCLHTHSLPALLIPHSQRTLHQSANSLGSTQGIQVNILSNGDSSLGFRHLWPFHLLIWKEKPVLKARGMVSSLVFSTLGIILPLVLDTYF